jgi:hypothetical protein
MAESCVQGSGDCTACSTSSSNTTRFSALGNSLLDFSRDITIDVFRVCILNDFENDAREKPPHLHWSKSLCRTVEAEKISVECFIV